MVHRFFLSPESIAGDRVTFDPSLTHQLRSVLRLRPGATVVVLDDSGWEFEVKLTRVDRDSALGRVQSRSRAETEPRLSLTLYQSVLKWDRFEWVLQKGTELGVSAFVPILSERTVIAQARQVGKKRVRWERIIREAAEQSHRARLPRLCEALSFPQACEQGAQTHDLPLILWEEAPRVSLIAAVREASAPRTVALWIGPEGGFGSDEVALAQSCGIRAVTLGPRILRAETAGLAATSIVMSTLGEMGK